MRENRPSGSMSGRWKQSMVGYFGTGNRKGGNTHGSPKLPRYLSTLPLESTQVADWPVQDLA
jgi:hypothetical protein